MRICYETVCTGNVDEAMQCLRSSYSEGLQQRDDFLYCRITEDIGCLFAQVLDCCNQTDECDSVYGDLLRRFPTGIFIGTVSTVMLIVGYSKTV
jgi:hypothetical protein